MNRFIDNWMKWFSRPRGVPQKDSLYYLQGGTKVGVRLKKRGLRGGLLLFTIAVAIGCGSTTTNQNKPIDASAISTDCREVQHALGETCVPLNPQRVVVVEGLETVLSLGVKPIGSTNLHLNMTLHLEDKLAGIENIGTNTSPNLEAIVALQPDLIIGRRQHNGEKYELLSQIAPTVLVEIEGSGDWKKLLREYAEVLGKTAEAEQIMADYQTRIDEFQAQMGDRLQETEVSNFYPRPGRLEVFLGKTFSGSVIADAGLPLPPAQRTEKPVFKMTISKEALHKLDGDVIFVWINQGRNADADREAQTALKQFKADPLWLKLNAVQQGKVYEVPYYWRGMGPIAANLVLDDLFEHLVDAPSQAAQAQCKRSCNQVQ